VLNIIVQNLFEKRRNEGKGPQRNTQNPNAPNRDIELNGGENFEGDQVAHL
jgi:hypothetical protein